MMSDTMRKQNLYAEIIILVSALNERKSLTMTSLTYPSQEEVDSMTLSDLEAMKREFRDLSRTLGGVSGR